jgi:hypothetical protein
LVSRQLMAGLQRLSGQFCGGQVELIFAMLGCRHAPGLALHNKRLMHKRSVACIKRVLFVFKAPSLMVKGVLIHRT